MKNGSHQTTNSISKPLHSGESAQIQGTIKNSSGQSQIVSQPSIGKMQDQISNEMKGNSGSGTDSSPATTDPQAQLRKFQSQQRDRSADAKQVESLRSTLLGMARKEREDSKERDRNFMPEVRQNFESTVRSPEVVRMPQ